VVDFFCPELALAIEIDGNSHDKENAYQKDTERQRKIEGSGIQFLRFNDMDIKNRITEHTPNPSQEGNYRPRRSAPSHEGN
jgi:very-short-patch-repair endonuclease